MAFVSVSQAATLVNRDRKTLYRDIATGKISAKIDNAGRKLIDTSELLRVFGAFSDATVGGVSTPHNKTPTPIDVDAQKELDRLRFEVAKLQAQLEAKDANLEDLRQAMKLLEHKKESKRRGWWPF